MRNISQGAAVVLASDLRTTFSAVDEAILSGARMFGSLVETAKDCQLPAAESQKLFDSVAAGLNSVIKGRADMVGAMKHMNVIKRHSNLDIVDIGCDNPLKFMTEALRPADHQPQAAA